MTLLGRYLAATINEEEKQKYYDKLFNFLEQYGDIYKRLNIELYVNPTTKKVLFPTNERIQANYIQYITDNGLTERDVSFRLTENYKKQKNQIIAMYNILLTDKLREIYNKFYISDQLAESESIKPKTYGIARLIGESTGGKKSKKQNVRKNKTIKNRKQHKKNKIKGIIRI